jgi:hypothetical protein
MLQQSRMAESVPKVGASKEDDTEPYCLKNPKGSGQLQFLRDG